jgi:hypothetical protein
MLPYVLNHFSLSTGVVTGGRDSVVSVATRYRLDGLGFEPRCEWRCAERN